MANDARTYGLGSYILLNHLGNGKHNIDKVQWK